MADFLMIVFSFLLLRSCIASSALPNALNTRFTFPSKSKASPSSVFEVGRPPISVPEVAASSVLVLQQDFTNTYDEPPAAAAYSPPAHCQYNRIVLEWSAASSGIQYDRIIGVWLSGVELLRSSTAEPSPTGIRWSVRKDVTRYASLFSKPQTLTVSLGNIVSATYTGVYRANISFYFYVDPSAPGFNAHADLVIPISRSPPLSDGLWFRIQDSADLKGKRVTIPRNAYRAVLELYVSFHGRDEFWYSNLPNSYISKNSIASARGNGAFREVTAMVDGKVVGVVRPFPVIYSGSFNPDLWRPVAGIGSFDLPSYDLEITPFLGEILNGRGHSFQFGVNGALDFWLIDANLHLWIDQKSRSTRGGLIERQAPASSPSMVPVLLSGLNGHLFTLVASEIFSTGWVESSHGNITTHFFQNLNFTNVMKIADNGKFQSVVQYINNANGCSARNSASLIRSEHITQSFSLYLITRIGDQIDQNSYTLSTNISLSFNEIQVAQAESRYSITNLKNLQSGVGIVHVKKNKITSGNADTQHTYSYNGTDGCYMGVIITKNNETVAAYKKGCLPTN